MLILKEQLRFADKFTLIKLLGVGGFSQVWLAKRDSGFQQTLKIYTGVDDTGKEVFRQEFENVYNINHPRILSPSDFGVFADRPYLIMPYYKNGSLEHHLGQLDERGVAKVMEDIGSALAYLHDQTDIIHQDIKPDNILIDDDRNYILTDFGISSRLRSTLRKSIARSDRATQMLAENKVASSGITPPSYRGPEFFDRDRNLRGPVKTTDIWAFGATLYELAAGELPYGDLGGLMQLQGAGEPNLPPHFSTELTEIIHQCMALDTWDRPRAADLAQYAQTFLATQTWPISVAEAKEPVLEAAEPAVPAAEPTPLFSSQPAAKPNSQPAAKPKWSKNLRWVLLVLIVLLGATGTWYAHERNLVQQATVAYDDGDAALEAGRFHEAKQTFRKSKEIKSSLFSDIDDKIKLAVDSIFAGESRYIARGTRHMEEGAYGEAGAAFQTALAYNPESDTAKARMARIQDNIDAIFTENLSAARTARSEGNFELAEEKARLAAEMKPESQAATKLLADIREEAEAAAFTRHMDAAKVQLQQGDFAAAAASVEQAEAVRNDPATAQLLSDINTQREAALTKAIRRGDSYAANKDCTNAKAQYRRALAIEPGNSSVKNKIASLRCIKTARNTGSAPNRYDCLKFLSASVTEQSTIVSLQLSASCGEAGSVNFYGPGSRNAYIVRAGGKTYPLRRLTGIQAGEKLKFSGNRTLKLYFDRLPENTASFDLIEGMRQIHPNMTYWNFKPIRLTWN